MSRATKTLMLTGWLTRQWTKALSGASIFYILALGFLVGVFFYSFFDFGLYAPAGLLLASIFALVSLAVFKSQKFFLLLLVSVALVFGMTRTLLVPDVEAPFVPYDNQKVVITGVVDADPDKRDTSTHIVVRAQTIDGENIEGLLQATLDRTAQISYGDSVQLSGKMQLPQPFETETGKEFDYPGYLRAKGVGAVMLYPTMSIESHAGVSLFGTLYSIKHALERAIENSLPEPAAGLLEGILLGNRAALGESLYDIFIIAGLVHIVVLSGYNLTIVADALMRLFSRAPKKLGFVVGAGGIVLFTLMVGAEAPVVRASIMALIVLSGRAFARSGEALRILFFACVLMVMHNPLILTADPSFVLSFLAAFGLITCAPAFEKYVSFVPEKWGIRGVVSATLATQAFIFPALIFYTGKLSLVALPANIVALPLVPPTMLFGFITGVLGLVHPYLAFVAMIPAWGLLSIIIWIAQVASAIPGAAVTVPTLQTSYIFILYVVLAPLALYLYSKAKSTKHA